MEPITHFRSIVAKQFDFYSGLAELDEAYCNPERWIRRLRPPRRGWTRRDKQAWSQMQWLSDVPPTTQMGAIRRISTAMRLFRDRQDEQLSQAMNQACDYCSFDPKLRRLGALILAVAEKHQAWLDWIQNGGCFDEGDYRRALSELDGGIDVLEIGHTEVGITPRDVGEALEYEGEGLTDWIERFSKHRNDRKRCNQHVSESIGKCPIDGRQYLYRLFGILKDLENFDEIPEHMKSKVIRTLQARSREPKS